MEKGEREIYWAVYRNLKTLGKSREYIFSLLDDSPFNEVVYSPSWREDTGGLDTGKILV